MWLPVLLTLPSARAVDLFSSWRYFSTPLPIPEVIDMTSGGSLQMVMGRSDQHSWGAGLTANGSIFGYARLGNQPTFPGPTILTAVGVPIEVTWLNNLSAPHVLDFAISTTLLQNYANSSCYPGCGVAAIVHLHGGQSPAIYDGEGKYEFTYGQSKVDQYLNRNLPGTLMYHDHAMGFLRLNNYAGMAGSYIIQNKTFDAANNLSLSCDIPMVLQDKTIQSNGQIYYFTNQNENFNCANNPRADHWVPDQFGRVDTINGVVSPYLNVPKSKCRFRIINTANSRDYTIQFPFYRKCTVIAMDATYVSTPWKLTSSGLFLAEFQRAEIICDFSTFAVGKQFNVTTSQSPKFEDTNSSNPYFMQIRVVSSSGGSSSGVIPSTLTNFKDFVSLYSQTNGANRYILYRQVDATGCVAAAFTIYYGTAGFNGPLVNANISTNVVIPCVKGTVEHWVIENQSGYTHPFHWHATGAMCSTTDGSPDTTTFWNVMEVTAGQTMYCYVACMPSESLVVGSSVSSTDFGFSTDEPYVSHCHRLEHGDNLMTVMCVFTIPGTMYKDEIRRISS